MALDQVEVLNDETPDPWMRIADFERQIADGAAKLEARFPEQSPIPVEHREQTFDGIVHAVEGGPQDAGFQHLAVLEQHGDQQVFFAREEVVQASALRVGLFQDLGDPGRGIALPEEELSGRFDDPLPGGRLPVT